MSSLRSSVFAGLLTAMVVGGCNCDPKLVNANPQDGGTSCAPGAPACVTDDDCPERNLCKKDNVSGGSCCVRSFRKCATDSSCCPGQVCTLDGRCVDKFDECQVNSDCGETPDRVCEQWTDPVLGASMRCTYAKCGSSGECPDGQSCFDQFCVVNPPCGGACPEGTACVPQAAGAGRCHPYGTHCSLKPKPGFLVVSTKPENVFDICKVADESCDYAELPPLPATDLGRHASVAMSAGNAVIAMYDGHYGDLVVSDYDLAGQRLLSAWVDGVPASGTIVGGPSGPRGGIADLGDDVGKYTSIAAQADGTVDVAYYDQTHGDLRFAARAADGTWTSHKVDGDQADLGLYSSLVIDPSGKPAVAYFQRAGSNDPSITCPVDPSAPKPLITGVKLARATVAHPASAADWTIEMVDCAGRVAPPCFGCTTAGATVCVTDATAGNGTTCKIIAAGCAPACSSGSVCVEGNVCKPQGSAVELADVPRGKGLFPSLAFKGASPVIAYYDRDKGNLMAALQTGATWDRKTLDGEDKDGDTGNVGLFPSLAVDAQGNLAIAYHDFTRRGLRYYSSPTLAPVAKQRTPDSGSFIDKGLSDPMADGPAWVGANASLVFSPGGTFVAYQNSTASDLRVSQKTASGWKLVKEIKDGGLGFFSHAVATSDGIVVVHTQLHAKIAGGRAIPDNTLKLELVRPTP